MATTEVHQTKAIGWYAVQRVRISDWLKPRRKKNTDDVDSAQASQASADNTTKPIHSSKSKSSQNTLSEKSESKASAESAASKKDEKSEKSTDEEKLLQKPSATSDDAKKLKAVVRESHTILAKARSVFPFQLFPDAVNIDRHKLTIIRRQFFGVEQKVSVPLENIKNIEVDVGPFFGSITVTSDLFINNTQTVHFLTRDDAKKIQKLVQGAVVAQGEGINLNKIDVKQLQKLLIDLGSGHSKAI